MVDEEYLRTRGIMKGNKEKSQGPDDLKRHRFEGMKGERILLKIQYSFTLLLSSRYKYRIFELYRAPSLA